MDRFSSMSIFVKAVELGSFSAAADALNMSPQLVGKHVQFLEQHLGVRLLNRTTRRQHLTEVGSQFYERCRNILAEVEAAEALAAETRAVPRGKLRVNAPVTFGIHALAPKLPKYLSAHPEVSIDLSLTNRMVDLIDEGYDTVFRIGDLADSGLIARRLDPYRLVACAAPSYLQSHGAPSRPDDLRDHECLIFSHTMLRTHWDFEGPEGSVSIPISGRLMIDNGEALLNAALAGLGIVLQSFELIQSSLETGALVPILPGYGVPTRPLHILYAPDRRVTPKLRSFLDFVSAEFGSHGSA
ncbi:MULTISPECIES: LysR family transcriptional regulator [unclassified Rhizobium]|uniref:LysR family transcriptional regulator n=1 Tax=unclassified Rhizobium TaxID=2613769 RepID=UPI000EAA9D95|nr:MULTISPECIES: LysR family transcriptional regulator [unclassified Rhizobium]AYG67727.1 LysR family transcriptional regulator [Rhizobium sp. CCGE531]AYG74118.1 LysR family transcriptional regulator [Rhizobium sp. CCGE532]